LKTAGSTSPITVNGGTLQLNSIFSTPVTTSPVTVSAQAAITGTATLQDLNLQAGATTRCQLSASTNTCLTVKGNLKHQGDTILVLIPATRNLQVGDEITVFKVSGNHTGNFFVKTIAEDGNDYQFDDSTLLTDGKLRVTSITEGISSVIFDNNVDTPTYNLKGQRVNNPKAGHIYYQRGKKYVAGSR
jgi:hypothetical protein